MKKQLVLFIGSENEYISFRAKNRLLFTNLKHISSRGKPENLEGYRECVVIITEIGNQDMTQELEQALARIMFSNTIIFL